jgi:Ca2+-dependent lipid-binding protein
MQLNVFVGGATGIAKMDTFGKSDPFIVLSLSESPVKKQTSVKDNTLTPVWNETFTFPLYNPSRQALTLLLKDKDVAADDDMATLEIQLAQLPIGAVVAQNYDFRPVKGVKTGGQVSLKLQIAAETVPPFSAWSLPPRPPGPHVLHLRIIAAEDIEKMDAVGKTDPYIVITSPGSRFQTTVKENTLNPKWDEDFHIPIQNPNDAVVLLALFDKDVASDDAISRAQLQTAIQPFGQILDTWILFSPVQAVKKPGRVHVLLHLTVPGKTPFQP